MQMDFLRAYQPSQRPNPVRSLPGPRYQAVRWRGVAFGAVLLAVATGAAALVHSGAAARLLPWVIALRDGPAARSDVRSFLARATLQTLHDANLTGNYDVFRALAAPDFRAANSPEALARIFAGLRRENVDLSVAAVTEPVWEEASGISGSGHYRIGGKFATGRHGVRFALAYASVDDQWRLIEIGVAADLLPQSTAQFVGPAPAQSK